MRFLGGVGGDCKPCRFLLHCKGRANIQKVPHSDVGEIAFWFQMWTPSSWPLHVSLAWSHFQSWLQMCVGARHDALWWALLSWVPLLSFGGKGLNLRFLNGIFFCCYGSNRIGLAILWHLFIASVHKVIGSFPRMWDAWLLSHFKWYQHHLKNITGFQ